MNEIEKFEFEKNQNIQKLSVAEYKNAGIDFITKTLDTKYCYNFTWMGRPIIQYPQDIIALQEIIWKVKPDLIIETGIAHGGSLIFHASMLELLGKGEVLGIDIDIRPHNRKEIDEHPMAKRIKMIEGSSVATDIFNKVLEHTHDKKNILVILDSNHTHDHVAKELKLYSTIVSINSYLIVYDTIIEDLPENHFADRPWNKGNNPKTAVWEFLKDNNNFNIDHTIQNKLVITVAPDGYLKRIK